MNKVCEIPDCESKVLAKGLCSTHYSRVRRTGDAGTAERKHRGSTPGETFTDEQKAEAVADYLAGEHSYDIALSLGTSNTTVLNWVRAAGHRIRTSTESRALDREHRAGRGD